MIVHGHIAAVHLQQTSFDSDRAARWTVSIRPAQPPAASLFSSRESSRAPRFSAWASLKPESVTFLPEVEMPLVDRNRKIGIGPKYARNMMMDVYHPDFQESVAVSGIGLRKM